MGRKRKISPVEIAIIRRALPYLKRHLRVPPGLEAAVLPKTRAHSLSRRDVGKVNDLLAKDKGPVLVRVKGKGLQVRLLSGPGRPFGSRNAPRKRRKRGPGRPPKAAA